MQLILLLLFEESFAEEKNTEDQIMNFNNFKNDESTWRISPFVNFGSFGTFSKHSLSRRTFFGFNLLEISLFVSVHDGILLD